MSSPQLSRSPAGSPRSNNYKITTIGLPAGRYHTSSPSSPVTLEVIIPKDLPSTSSTTGSPSRPPSSSAIVSQYNKTVAGLPVGGYHFHRSSEEGIQEQPRRRGAQLTPEAPRTIVSYNTYTIGLPNGGFHTGVGTADEVVVARILFNTVEKRLEFVRKVYGIISLQLVFASIFVAVSFFNLAMFTLLRSNFTSLLVSGCGFVITYLLMLCFETLRRSSPCNVLMLLSFTVFMAWLASSVAALFKEVTILLLFIASSAIYIAVLIRTYFQKSDFKVGTVLITSIFVCFILLPITFVALHNYLNLLLMVLWSMAVFCFSLFQAVDLRLMLKGKTIQIKPSEYVMCVLHLYLDIVLLFSLIFRRCKQRIKNKK